MTSEASLEAIEATIPPGFRRRLELLGWRWVNFSAAISLGFHGNNGDDLPGTGWGPQDSVQLVYKWLNSMVYGRYNYCIHGDYFMVNKPTNITGGPHPV
jgi:hypothetical protein